MKRFIAIFLALLSLSVSAKDAFDCENVGFSIDGNRAAYGSTELVLCATKGNWLYFSEPGECKLEKKYNITFDKITYLATIRGAISPTSVIAINCKKVK